MSRLDGRAKLSRLTLPGTHDSGALHSNSAGELQTQTQDSSLSRQLQRGVRVLDIRMVCVETRRGTNFAVHHGVKYQWAYLDAASSSTGPRACQRSESAGVIRAWTGLRASQPPLRRQSVVRLGGTRRVTTRRAANVGAGGLGPG
jgi:hypothetical protein